MSAEIEIESVSEMLGVLEISCDCDMETESEMEIFPVSVAMRECDSEISWDFVSLREWESEREIFSERVSF
jgi:hypothetical protein